VTEGGVWTLGGKKRYDLLWQMREWSGSSLAKTGGVGFVGLIFSLRRVCYVLMIFPICSV
jgi:hypothetical protein